MAIADTIQSMYDNVSNAYNVLEVAGADLTNVDKNILNLKTTWQERLLYFMNNGTDVVWNNWEKVEGAGETLTLNSTEEAPMKINLKGNTSQETTTGKNLLDNNGTSATKNGVTYTINQDKSITLNGTSTQAFIFDIDNGRTLDAGTYTLSLEGKIQGCGIYLYVNQTLKTYVSSNNSSDNWKTNFTLDSTTTFNEIRIDVQNNKTFNNVTIYPMIRLSSVTDDTYEPYTNGASPNPSYPQDIHVVSGDNSIDVSNNTFDISTITTNKAIIGTTGVINNSAVSNLSDYTEIVPNSFCKLSYDYDSLLNTTERGYCFYDGSKTFLSGAGYNATNKSNILITPSNAKYIRFSYDKNCTNVKLASQVKIYPLSLTGVNIFDKGNVNSLKAFFNSSTTSTLTYYAEARTLYIKCLPNTTYTISKTKGVKFYVGYLTTRKEPTTNNTVLGRIGGNDTTEPITITTGINATYLVIFYYNANVDTYTEQEILDTIQIQYGNQATIYEAYHTLELCKIGDYQDYIAKSTGKNLFDKDNLTIEIGTISATGSFDYSTERVRAYWVEVKENTQYTASTSNSDLQIVPYFYNANKTFISFDAGWKNFPYTFTTPSNTKYVAFLFKNSNNNPTPSSLTNIQIEEGSTATPYQPYGKVWYLNKQIGKVVLDNTKNWTYASTSQGSLFRSNNTITNSNSNQTYIPFSNCYKGIAYSGSGSARTNNNFYINPDNNYVDFIDNRYTSADDFKTFIGNNNVYVYYPLATPTYAEITDTTLLSQLEALNGARSYTTQTNISQTNNDLPFILDVTALKQLN